jgi:hypothetical protein
MLAKAVRFYLAAMRESGLTVSPFFSTPRAAGPNGRKKPIKRKPKLRPERRDDSGQEVPADSVQFKLPIPGKGDGVFVLPESIDQADWDMLKLQLDAWVSRLVRSSLENEEEEEEEEEEEIE